MNTDNLTLALESDSKNYEQRQKICASYLQTNNHPAAVKAMVLLIQKAITTSPSCFDEDDRKKDVQVAAACELISTGSEELGVFEACGSPKNQHAHTKFEATTAKIPSRSVSDDVMVVLRQCSVDQAKVFLPASALDRALYVETKRVLEALGGKWTAGKTQAFVFGGSDPESFAVAWQGLQDSGSYTDPKDMSFFPTPDFLASQLVQLAGLQPGMRVCEPSAGRGAIALKAADIVGKTNVTCVELFPPNARALEREGLMVLEGDYLAMTPPTLEENKYDCVIMNPPFSNHQDAAHVAHACHFIKSSGRLVAITSTAWSHQENNRKAAEFRAFVEDVGARVSQVPAGTFKNSGTMVPTQILVIEGRNLPWNQNHQPNPDIHDGKQFDDEEALSEVPTA